MSGYQGTAHGYYNRSATVFLVTAGNRNREEFIFRNLTVTVTVINCVTVTVNFFCGNRNRNREFFFGNRNRNRNRENVFGNCNRNRENFLVTVTVTVTVRKVATLSFLIFSIFWQKNYVMNKGCVSPWLFK